MVASWGCRQNIWCWGQPYSTVLLAATLFSILGKQGCVVGVSAAYSALGAARIVGSVFTCLSAATSFSILGKQGCVLAVYLALGAALSAASYFSISGKQGCVEGVTVACLALGAALSAASVFASVVSGNFFLHFY
jgi:hypothetical protein